MSKILKNAIKCVHCGDVIESRYTHEFVTCSCGRCSADGGHEYLKRVGNAKDYIEMSEVDELEADSDLNG
jgi:hypothetical protein